MPTKKSTSLENFAAPIKSRNQFIKASFGGFAGSGKTRTATEFVIGSYRKLKLKKPVLIIDNEKGARFLIPKFEQAKIKAYIKDTTTLADTLEAFKILSSGEVDYLFIDSLSKIWYQYINDFKAKNRINFMSLQQWGKVIPAWQSEFADRFVNIEGNIVFTGRGGYVYDLQEDEETGKKEFAKSGVKMKVAGETPFEPDLNVWMGLEEQIQEGRLIQWRSAQVMKDRADVIDGKTFKNPTFKEFEPVLDFIMGLPEGEVKGASDTTNLAPAETYNTNKQKRDVILADIKGIYANIGIGGTSGKDKQLNAKINEMVFETNSWESTAKLPLEDLEKGLKILVDFKQRYSDSVDLLTSNDDIYHLAKDAKKAVV